MRVASPVCNPHVDPPRSGVSLRLPTPDRGTRGRAPGVRGGARRPYDPLVQARPRCSAAVAASTGTATGWGAPATAQSGSLSPLPVTVQTTV